MTTLEQPNKTVNQTKQTHPMKLTWQCLLFGSGTQVVTTSKFERPHFYIGHVNGDNEGEHARHHITKDLEAWLNGGHEPEWFNSIERSGPDAVLLSNGCNIRATGPMIDANPGSWNWVEDDSADAQIDRGLLIDAICKRIRPA